MNSENERIHGDLGLTFRAGRQQIRLNCLLARRIFQMWLFGNMNVKSASVKMRQINEHLTNHTLPCCFECQHTQQHKDQHTGVVVSEGTKTALSSFGLKGQPPED